MERHPFLWSAEDFVEILWSAKFFSLLYGPQAKKVRETLAQSLHGILHVLYRNPANGRMGGLLVEQQAYNSFETKDEPLTTIKVLQKKCVTEETDYVNLTYTMITFLAKYVFSFIGYLMIQIFPPDHQMVVSNTGPRLQAE